MEGYLLVPRTPGVRLVNSTPKDSHSATHGRKLEITVDPSDADALKDFTTENVGGSVAFLLDGEIVSVHKVREPITGGTIQVTWCGKNSCRLLMIKLGT